MSRELDAEVAEKVLGWAGCFDGIRVVEEADKTQEFYPEIVTCQKPDGKYTWLPYFSINIAAAFKLVADVQRRDPANPCNFYLVDYAYNRAYAIFGLYGSNLEWDTELMGEGNGKHYREEAICRAALLYVQTQPTTQPPGDKGEGD